MLTPDSWIWQGERFPYADLQGAHDLLLGRDPIPAGLALYRSLIKLVPTEWGPPTFEIDGIKMLPDGARLALCGCGGQSGICAPAGKVVLDTCGGLGYFAAWCLQGGAAQVLSCEKNPDVIWLRPSIPGLPRRAPGCA